MIKGLAVQYRQPADVRFYRNTGSDVSKRPNILDIAKGFFEKGRRKTKLNIF